MPRYPVAVLALSLAGCASSVSSLGDRAPKDVLHSAKIPDDVAGCISFSLNGSNPARRVSDQRWLIVRNNAFGSPAIRYDIEPEGKGSMVTVRAASPVGAGMDKVRACL